MYNQNLVQAESIVTVATTTTLGFNVGQVVPARYIICEPTANMTITLPLSTPTLPTATALNYIPGVGPGYPITFINNNSGGFSVTLAAATGDTLTNVPTLSSQYSAVTVFSSPSENIWYGDRSATSGLFPITVALTATSASQQAFLSDGNYKLISISESHGTASSSGTLQLEKATGTQAIASGTNMLTGTMTLAGTANTPVSGTLVATLATLLIAAGNRLNLIIAGTMTSLANSTVTIILQRQ